MQRDFINQLEAKKTGRKVLDEPRFKAIWQNQPPKIFTTKVGEADTIIAEITEAQQAQELGTEGPTGNKEIEEAELEQADIVLAKAVVLYAKDHPGKVT